MSSGRDAVRQLISTAELRSGDCRRGPRGTPLAPRQLARLRAVVDDAGSVDACARRLNLPPRTIARALAEKPLYASTRNAFGEALTRDHLRQVAA